MRWVSILASEGFPMGDVSPEVTWVKWGWLGAGAFVGGIVGAAVATLLWAPVATLAAVAFGVLLGVAAMCFARMAE